MSVEPLVFTTREDATVVDGPVPTLNSTAVENVHYGSIAVVAVDGGLQHRAGDPHWPTFTRSTLKAFQALPFVREGGASKFGWTSRQVALMCASHSGEAMHTEVVRSMLASAECDESDLQCGCHVPGWYAALGKTPPADARWSPVEHNCSGKHAGFLAACRLHGEPVEHYLDPSAPLQRRIATAVATLAEVEATDMARGTDGCSAPNYRLPLSRLALLYAKLAQGAAAPVEGAALGSLYEAMTEHPQLVSGTARSDLSLMTFGAGDWVTKIGADGVQAIGIRSRGIGIAVKIVDGNRDALFGAVVEVLRQLDLAGSRDSPPLPADFAAWHRTRLRNARGRVTGRVVPAFKLRSVA